MRREGRHSHDGFLDARSERAVAALARGQEGMVSSAQLRAADVTQDAAESRVRSGRWYRRHRGVYSLGPPRETWPARLWAALLACGGPAAAVFSHRTAGALWHLCAAPKRIDVITLGESRSTRAIHVHRGRLEPDEITHDRDHGLPVTTPMRAILDVAATSRDEHRLERMVHRAAELHLLDASRIPPGRRGSARVRAAMATLPDDQPRITRSDLEEAFLRFLHDHRLPQPLTNHPVNGHIVDAYWPHARLVVELDSHEWHDNPVAFEADRARDQDHVLAGDRVIRLTSRHLTPRTADRLRALLS
jgi:very-short-patch-repair endonuclease